MLLLYSLLRQWASTQGALVAALGLDVPVSLANDADLALDQARRVVTRDGIHKGWALRWEGRP